MIVSDMARPNPFSFHGGLAKGRQFVGRHRQISFARQRCLETEQPGSLAIIGMPRIGKSSLAWNVFIDPQEQLAHRKVLTAWVNVSKKGRPADLFLEMAREVLNAVVGTCVRGAQVPLLPLIQDNLKKILPGAEWDDIDDAISRFFGSVRDAGFTVVVVLDEFDYLRTLFAELPIAFHLLREVANNAAWGICLVTVSRRPVAEIEDVACPGNSTLDGIFMELQVPCFTSEEMTELLSPLDETTLPREELDPLIAYYCGNQPYFGTGFAFQAAFQWLTSSMLNIPDIIAASEPMLFREYTHVLDLLTERDLRNTLLGVIFGPRIDVKPAAVSQLKQYGILQEGEKKEFTTFSPHFYGVLKDLHREVDLWPLWTNAEKSIRRLLDAVLSARYECLEWSSKAIEVHPQLAQVLGDLESRRSAFLNRNPAASASNLLDYANPSEYMPFISAHWSSLSPILGDGKKLWNDRFELLSWVRRPMAHSNDEFIPREDRITAEQICRLIFDRVSQWERSQEKSD